MAAAALLAVLTSVGASTASAQSAPGARAPATALSPAEVARADGGIAPFTKADVNFMQGMIGHHSQAVVMAGWAPSHGASPTIQTLCERIIVSQSDEINFMSRWLGDRKQTVPDASEMQKHAKMGMAMHDMMPGMLTAEQMAELDKARGPEFDRLFLTFMIQHHRGALSMVDALFGSQGAGQDEDIFKFASDVASDQTAEIDRMTGMLASRGTPQSAQ